MISVKWIRKSEAAEYLNVSEAGFDRNVRPFIGTYVIGRTPIFKLSEIDSFMETLRTVRNDDAKIIPLARHRR